jgi:hypothetical protein
LLTAATECSRERYETLILVPSGLRESEFSGKERPLAVQHFEIGRGASLITHVRQPDGLLQVRDAILLTKSDLRGWGLRGVPKAE